MTPIRKKLIDLRGCIDKILEAPLESAASIKAEVVQSISMDKDAIEALGALSDKIDGNVFFVQAAQINAQVIKNSAAALRHLTDIERYCYENGVSLDQNLDDLLKKGWKLPQIEQLIRDKCFEIMERKVKNIEGKSNKAEVARRLGINRTTYIERKKRLIKD